MTKKPKDSEWSVNRLAAATGIDRRTCSKILQAVPPLREDGKIKYYSLASFCSELRGSSLSDWNKERFLKLTAERKLAELTFQKERNQLIDVVILEKQMGGLAEDFKSDLLGIPDQMSDKFAGKMPREISKMLEDRIWAAMGRFGQALKKSKSKLGVTEQKEEHAKADKQNTDTGTITNTNTKQFDAASNPGGNSETQKAQ